MKSRWISILFTLLFLVFLITAARHIAAPLLDLHLFQLETKLIYLILASVVFGGLLLFLLVTFFPPWLKNGYRSSSGAATSDAPSRRIVKVQTALELGQWNEAMELLDDFTAADPDYWLARKIKGDARLHKGEFMDAAKEYEEAGRYASGEALAMVLLAHGNLYEQQDQLDEAHDIYERVVHSVPESSEAVHRLRNLAVREQNWEEALNCQDLLERQFSNEPESSQESNWKVGIRYQLAKAAAQSGNYKTAQALLKYIFRLTDYFTPAYLLQAEIQERQQNPATALKTYEQGFLKTQNPILLKRISESFLMDNLPEIAIQFLRQTVQAHSGDHRIAFCLGDLYRKLEMTGEALKIFESIRQKHPDWLLNNRTLADLYYRSGNKEGALVLYKQMADQSEAFSVQPWQCYNCNTTYLEYSGFCTVCTEWNSIHLNQNKAGNLDFGYEKPAALPL
jgi:tetratricopeptide (TPR) repeat protein